MRYFFYNKNNILNDNEFFLIERIKFTNEQLKCRQALKLSKRIGYNSQKISISYTQKCTKKYVFAKHRF